MTAKMRKHCSSTKKRTRSLIPSFLKSDNSKAANLLVCNLLPRPKCNIGNLLVSSICPNMQHPSASNYRLYLLHLRFAQYAEPGAPNYQANHWICIFCMPPWDENINCTFGTSKLRMYIFVNYNTSNKLLCIWCDPLATNGHAIHAKHDTFHLVCLMIKLTKWKFNTILMYLLRDSKLHLLIELFAIRFFFSRFSYK